MLVFEDMVHIQPKPPDEYSNVSRSGSEAQKSVIKGRFKIHKSDDDKMLAFGWANIAITAEGDQITDLQEDVLDTDVL